MPEQVLIRQEDPPDEVPPSINSEGDKEAEEEAK